MAALSRLHDAPRQARTDGGSRHLRNGVHFAHCRQCPKVTLYVSGPLGSSCANVPSPEPVSCLSSPRAKRNVEFPRRTMSLSASTADGALRPLTKMPL